jgi:hypothetical protein
MAQSRNFIPAWLRGNNGDCLGIVTQALRWRLEPYWIAQHAYISKADGLVTYDSAVHAAIVISSGLLKDRPRYELTGEGEERRCTVYATFKGETEPHEYTTPPLKQCRPRRNDKDTVKGSPLWDRDPDQQLGYYAVRNWGRRHAPELLGGVYARDEFDDASQDAEPAAKPSPELLQRLPGRIEGAGFGENGDIGTLLAEDAPAATSKPTKGRKKDQLEATEKPADAVLPPEGQEGRPAAENAASGHASG